jgi:lysophospholipase L1-like esterase
VNLAFPAAAVSNRPRPPPCVGRLARDDGTVPRKLILVAIGCGLALVLLELVLQIAAFAIGVTSSAPARHGSGTGTILCVGDSFTFGLGASDRDHAYPARLAQELADAGAPRPVVNCGWPGATSRDVLLKLPGQLATHGPTLVYVLVGYNDFWREPPPLEIATEPAATGFRFELRTLVLLRMISHALRGGDVDALPPFVGEWHAGESRLQMRADGTMTLDGVDMHWSVRDDRLVLHPLERAGDFDVDWRMDGDALVVRGAFAPNEIRFAPGPLLRHDLDRARAALSNGDDADGERLLRACFEQPSLAVPARAELVALLARTGRQEAANAELDPLRTAWNTAPERAVGLAFAESLLALDQAGPALEVVASLLEAFGADRGTVDLIVARGLEAGDPVRLRAAVEHALARTDLDPDLRIGLLGAKGRLAEDDPVVAMACLIEVWRLRPNEDFVHKTVLREPHRFAAAALEPAFERLALPATERQAFRTLWERAFVARDRTGEILQDHLRRIVAACREAGAVPVLLVYPIEKPEVELAVRALAATDGTAWVDVRAPFRELLAREPWSAYFILDGHCNDRGYAVMAETIARDARSR